MAFTFELDKRPALKDGFELLLLREAFAVLNGDMFSLASYALEILYFYKNSRFCPACGTKTAALAKNSRVCPACKKEQYPLIAAACMVLVKKGKEILMVRGRNFKGKHYGLVAGFLEPGETLEQCAEREVLEETGLKIKNLKYFSSQPWPFPSNEMVGFTADYAGGKIKIQKEELLSAEFFTKENLPLLPGKISLAYKMVDAWLKGKV